MERRSFVKSTALMAAAGAAAPKIGIAASNPPKTTREFYELREYILRSFDQQHLVESYFGDALIPAFKRLGHEAVGVFTELKPSGQSKLYALIPHNSLEDFTGLPDKLEKDPVY